MLSFCKAHGFSFAAYHIRIRLSRVLLFLTLLFMLCYTVVAGSPIGL